MSKEFVQIEMMLAAHGDWMEEWRFLTFVLPLLALGFAESVRALARIIVVAVPRSLRAPPNTARWIFCAPSSAAS